MNTRPGCLRAFPLIRVRSVLTDSHSLHSVNVFSFHGQLTVETFAQRGLAASSLNHCGHTGLHPSHRRLLVASFYVGRPYSVTIPSIWDDSPRTFGLFSDARLVTPSSLSCSMLSATPGCRLALVSNAPSVLPAPIIKGSAHSQKSRIIGAMGQIQSIQSSPRLTRVPAF